MSDLSTTQRFARGLVRQRIPAALALLAATAFFAIPVANTVAAAFGLGWSGPSVRIDSRARDLFPDHPYLHVQDTFEPAFGGASLVAMSVEVEEGTIFRPDVLAALAEITRELDGRGFSPTADIGDRGLVRALRLPTYPVNHDLVHSLLHPSTRVLSTLADGSVEQRVLAEAAPRSAAEAAALRDAVRRMPTATRRRLVSEDERAALVTAGFVTDRLDGRAVYRALFEHVRGIEARWEARIPGLEIHATGVPLERGWILSYADQILWALGGSLALIFALLWLYFRRWHGVVIPAITAGTTALWGLGFAGWAGIPFDPLILVIPMLISARAISHTVQMAERFFEDYALALPRFGNPERAKIEAATTALGALLVPGTLGIVTDVAGLLVLLVTSIPQMQHLALFGAFWVASIVVTVEVLHPLLICLLPPPRRHEHRVPRVAQRVVDAFGRAATHPRGKFAIAGATLLLLVGCGWITLTRSSIGDTSPGTPLLWPEHPFNVATRAAGARFGGSDALVVYAAGDRPNASIDAAPVRAMDAFEHAMARETALGASVSLAPVVREAWRRHHYGDPKWAFVPGDDGTLRALIFELRQNGPPGFLRSTLSDDASDAKLAFFYPDRRAETITSAIDAAQRFIRDHPLGALTIRLERDRAAAGATWSDPSFWLDGVYYLLGPLLPPRHHTLRIVARDAAVGQAGAFEARVVARDGWPRWIDAFQAAAHAEHAGLRAALPPDAFHEPEILADWSLSDVSQWWESEDFGVRALVVGRRHLLVEDLRAVDAAPRHRPAGAWTRGVQFVLAGGSLGTLAAIHEEVERSHVANISLIFFVIFSLHALTYRSLTSGGIVLLQVATATLLALAVMALRGVGLNVHTLPVQSVGVGIGVDYAIYIVDRIRQERARTGDLDAAIRRAVSTTGLAVCFTATTISAGVALWAFSALRFQAEMAGLLAILMGLNMLGALLVVPAFTSILKPSGAARTAGTAQE